MKLLTTRVDVKGRLDTVDVDLYADTHFGSKSVDEELLRYHISETKREGRMWLFLGDGIEGITPKDYRRWNPDNVTDWAWRALKEKRLIEAEWEYWGKMFEPIAPQCIAALNGDGKHNVYHDVADCMGNVMRKLRITSNIQLLYHTFAISRMGGTTMASHFVFHHGYFAGRTSGSKINNLERSLSYFPEALGFFCGHGHTKVQTQPITGIVKRGGKGASIYKRGAMTGSYLRTYAEDTTGYGEVKLYPPVALGRITMRLAPFHPRDQHKFEIYNI